MPIFIKYFFQIHEIVNIYNYHVACYTYGSVLMMLIWSVFVQAAHVDKLKVGKIIF